MISFKENPTSVKRLTYFSPLRYPGGKGKLTPFIKDLIEENGLNDGIYVEPYAGGAAIGLELLFHEYVSQININDISRPIYAFWKSALNKTEELNRLIHDTKPTVRAWDKQKKILDHPSDHDDLSLGFATFFLNRTNRSGILNGGIIGGRAQTGPWKIDARFNPRELTFRIESIAKIKSKIKLSKMDAMKFLRKNIKNWPSKTLIYLDPPYYIKGKDLYLDYYEHADHHLIAEFVTKQIFKQNWIVSYDNVKPISQMYSGFRGIRYKVGYTAREFREGKEVMFFSKNLRLPSFTKFGKNASILPKIKKNNFL